MKSFELAISLIVALSFWTGCPAPSPEVNQAPVVDAGRDHAITWPARTVTLDGAVTDTDGPNPVAVTWSDVAGPGSVAFGDLHAVHTTATFSLVGAYVLRLQAYDGNLYGANTVSVIVHPAGDNQAPVVAAGPDQAITWPAQTVTLHGAVTDDGLPGPPQLDITWAHSSGSGTVTFGAPHSEDTTAAFSAPGVYVLTLSAFDGDKTGEDFVAVTVNDAASEYPDKVVDRIAWGGLYSGLAVTPDGGHVYVADLAGNTVLVMRTSDNTVIDTITVGWAPDGVAITPDGDHVYVANTSDCTVSVIRTSDNTVVDTITVGIRPHGVAVTPTGGYVYVANGGADDSVSVIRTSDNTVIDTIPVGDGPRGVAVTPNGSYVYVTNSHSDTVSVIRTSDNTVVDTITVGILPRGVAVTPTGGYVYVTNGGADDTVSVIRTSDNTVIHTMSVGEYPAGSVAVTPNGGHVYVTNMSDDSVSVIRTSDNTVIDRIAVGFDPFCVAVSPDGDYVYVTDEAVNVIGK